MLSFPREEDMAEAGVNKALACRESVRSAFRIVAVVQCQRSRYHRDEQRPGIAPRMLLLGMKKPRRAGRWFTSAATQVSLHARPTRHKGR